MQHCAGFSGSDTITHQPATSMADWYYYTPNKEKIGPVRGRVLKQLVQQGIITPETFVEDPNGRTGLAKDVKGLTFTKTTEPENAPGEVSSVLLPSSAEQSATIGLAEDLAEQDFERIRADIERLQEQEATASAPQNNSAPPAANPFSAPVPAAPVAPNPFSAALPPAPATPVPVAPIAANPFTASVPAAEQSVPRSTLTFDAEKFGVFFAGCGRVIETCSTWIQVSVVVGLFLVVIGGIGWSCLPNDWQSHVNDTAERVRIAIGIE